MKTVQNYLKYLFFIIILIWFLLSIGRLVLNLSKIYTEERFWIGLSDENKRTKIFGDVYIFLLNIDKKIKKNNDVIALSKDGKNYFLARYMLYPQKIYWVKTVQEVEKMLKTKKYRYILIFYPQNFNLNFNVNNIFSSNKQIQVKYSYKESFYFITNE